VPELQVELASGLISISALQIRSNHTRAVHQLLITNRNMMLVHDGANESQKKVSGVSP
jgi:hypothetical protein